MNAGFQLYEGKEPYIFISYSRNDNVRAHSLFDALRRAGYRRLSDYSGIEHFALALGNEDAFAPCKISP